MATDQDTMVHEITDRIRRATDPDRIVLFGSRARGESGASSDFDVLVVRESDEPRHRRSGPLYTLLADLPIEVDIMVYTPSEIEDWQAVPEAFVSTAMREGITVYERAG